MCGIVGLVNFTDPEVNVKKALEAISYRGKDHSKIVYHNSLAIGHNLHSVIDFVIQPLETEKSILVSNCEIYNWKTLAKKYKIKANNDSELIQKILDQKKTSQFVKIVEQLDGDYAFVYYSKREEKLFIARDIIGVKPLVYFFDEKTKQFAFASEKKALNSIKINSIHLNPRQILVFDLKKQKISFIDRKIRSRSVKSPLPDIRKTLISAVEKRIPDKEFALLLSGGLDSALIVKILKQNKVKFKCLFAGVFDEQNLFSDPKDLTSVEQVAKKLNLTLSIRKVTIDEFEKELPKIITLIESSDPIRVGVASTIYFASKDASTEGVKVVLSGLGADELFAGYHRFKNSNNINKDCYSYLIKMYENDLYFEDIITMANKLELRVPFLDRELVEKSLKLPVKYKLVSKKEQIINKKILRDIALGLKLPTEVAMREKKAAQYGSNFDKAIDFLAKKRGFKSKADYLNSIALNLNKSQNLSQKNIPIAALLSTGKDSVYALHLMEKQGYDVRCLIAINPENKDSFMFHTPTIELAKLQAKSMGKRLLLIHSKGEKEKELAELERGLMLAKKMFKVEGVCSGALFSNYQRERIERACEKHGLRHFAPLWHLDQEQYLRQVIKSGFEVIISKIASYGLSEKWIGRVIDENAINELVELNKKVGINIAGEGGEYESLVLNAPMFKEKIYVEFIVKMQNENAGEIELKKIELKKK
jgi:asparagine synthase (glutamine-hydrolysing)